MVNICFSFPAQTRSSVIVAEVTLADNGLGLMPLVYSPPSLLHLYADKTIRVQVCGPPSGPPSGSPVHWSVTLRGATTIDAQLI